MVHHGWSRKLLTETEITFEVGIFNSRVFWVKLLCVQVRVSTDSAFKVRKPNRRVESEQNARRVEFEQNAGRVESSCRSPSNPSQSTWSVSNKSPAPSVIGTAVQNNKKIVSQFERDSLPLVYQRSGTIINQLASANGRSGKFMKFATACLSKQLLLTTCELAVLNELVEVRNSNVPFRSLSLSFTFVPFRSLSFPSVPFRSLTFSYVLS